MTEIILARPADSGEYGDSDHGPMTSHGSRSSDQDLLDPIARDGGGPLVDLYERHHGCVRDLAVRLFGPKMADQITREVFLTLWTSPRAVDTSAGVLCSELQRSVRERTLLVNRPDRRS
jgi:hypothetical protein